jgi:hypothetical protein
VIVTQPKPETRTAREVEDWAERMDGLQGLYRRDLAAGLEGIRSVPDDLYSWDPFAELLFMERLLRGTCDLPEHRGLTKHAAAH